MNSPNVLLAAYSETGRCSHIEQEDALAAQAGLNARRNAKRVHARSAHLVFDGQSTPSL